MPAGLHLRPCPASLLPHGNDALSRASAEQDGSRSSLCPCHPVECGPSRHPCPKTKRRGLSHADTDADAPFFSHAEFAICSFQATSNPTAGGQLSTTPLAEGTCPALPCPALPCPTLSYPATCWPCFDLPFAWLSLRDSKRRRARLERLTALSLRSLFCCFLPCVK